MSEKKNDVIDNTFLLNVIVGMEEKRIKQSENNVKVAKIIAFSLIFCVLIICGTILAINYYVDETVEEIYIEQDAENNSSNSVSGIVVGNKGEVWQADKQ